MSKRLTLEDFITRSSIAHANKYDYSVTDYSNSSVKVKIICPIHGIFEQYPQDHVRGFGCSKCAQEQRGKNLRLTQEEFLTKSLKIHGGKYDYSKVNYTTSGNKVEIICPEHGSFFQDPASHLSGRGCRKCKYQNHSILLTDDTESFIRKAKHVHGETYDYSKVNYVDSKTEVIITCKTHGDFLQNPTNHLNNESGCPTCAYEIKGINLRSSTTEFIKKANIVHGNVYDYSQTNYTTASDKVNIICKTHGLFVIKAGEHIHNKRGCPSCSASISKPETHIMTFLNDLGISFIKKDRTIIKPLELDFYLPDHKIAIEFDGTYYHSELSGGKSMDYHLNKTKKCEELGIRLIHVFEPEYINNQRLLWFKLKNILGLTKYKIHARKCMVKPIDKKTKKEFINRYHLQGDVKSCVELGLFYKNRLLQVMTFSKGRVITGQKSVPGKYELTRMCSINNFNVVGGASKLLKYFERNYSPKELVSYADKRWCGSENVFLKMGFLLSHESKPNYWYLLQNKNSRFWHRYMFAKHTLQKRLSSFDPILTEWENMKNNGYDRIWDCGNYVLVKKYDKY